MKVLVLGASGLLGSNVLATASDHADSVVGACRSREPDIPETMFQCDLTDPEDRERVLETADADLVVNCAAMTDVDQCEREPDAARSINATTPGAIARQCAERNATLVHLSTDYVFGGHERTRYDEDDDPDPLQTYGETKLAGERAVREAMTEALVVRLSFLYGMERPSAELTGFPAWVRNELMAGNDVALFTDQYVTPTRAGAAAEAIFELADRDACGTFHVASRDCLTPCEFGRRIAERIDASGNIERVSRKDVNLTAPRPTYTCLDMGKIERTLERPQPTLDTDLSAVSL